MPLVDDDLRNLRNIQRRQEWAIHVSSLTSMAHHPGQNKDNALPLTDEQIYALADKHLKAADERFGWNDHG